MKNLKSKIIIMLLALMLPVTSLFICGNNRSDDVYAKTGTYSDLSNTASKNFVVSDDLDWTKVTKNNSTVYENSMPLYSTGEDTLNYYNIDVQYSVSSNISVVWTQDKTFKDDTLYLYGDSSLTPTVTYLVTAKVVLPKYMVGNRCFNYQLSANSTTCAMALNGSTEILNGATLSSNELEVSYSLTSKDNVKFSIVAPKLTITCDDLGSPTIDVLSDTNRDNSIYRTINFGVSDDGVGLDLVKYYKGTKDNHNVSDEIIFLNSVIYSFDANYDSDYTIEAIDLMGNTSTYFVSKDNENNINPSLTNLKVSNRNKELQFHLNYAENTSKHSSEDSIYYSILTLQEYSAMAGDNNALIAKVTNNPMGKLAFTSTNTISIGMLEEGIYYIVAVAKDMAGNVCSQVASAMFKYNTTKYTLNLPQLNGGHYTKVAIDGEDYCDEGSNFYNLDIYADEVYIIEFEADNGYMLVGVEVDGNIVSTNNSYTSICAGNIEINGKFKYIIDVNFDSEFTFVYNEDNSAENSPLLRNLLESFSLIHAQTKDIVDVEKNIDLIAFEIYDVDDNLAYVYNCQGQLTGGFYNAGMYKIVWRIVGDFEDDYIQTNMSNKYVQIVPKVITGITYSGNSDLSYTGEYHTLNFDLSSSSIENTNEQLELNHLITFNYYLNTDLDKTNCLSGMLNAGTYYAQAIINSNNYTIVGDIIDDIVVSKKEVQVAINNLREYKYNENVQALEFTNDSQLECDDFVVTYQILNGEIYEDSIFQNVGNYKYNISLSDECQMNYNLTSVENVTFGNCEMVAQDVYVVIEKNTFDYIGATINVSFKVYNGEGEGKVEIISPSNAFSCVSIDDRILKDEGEYYVTIKSNNSGYNVHVPDGGYLITIIKTTIYVSIVKEYEFDGNNKNITYYFANKDGERLLDLDGLTLEIYKDSVLQTEISQVGEYVYKFVSNNGYEYDVVNGEGTIQILPAIINASVQEEYEYCPNGEENLGNYNIVYSLISTQNTNFANLGFISLEITNINNLDWGDIGVYGYTLKSNNDSVLFLTQDVNGDNSYVSQLTGEIEIVARKVNVTIKNVYTYLAQEQTIEYSIQEYYGLEDNSIVLNLDNTMKEVGNYTYTLNCTDENYSLVVENANIDELGNTYVTIVSKSIGITNITLEYTYSGNTIEVLLALENPYDEVIDYQITQTLNGETKDSIIDAGLYNVDIISSNNNYIINYENLEIRVLPKYLNVLADNNIQKVYNGEFQTIEYTFEDENQDRVSVESTVVFEKGGNTVYPKNAGEYRYQIIVNNENYYIEEKVGVLTITPKKINVTPQPLQSKVYGEEDKNIAYFLVGVVDGDNVNVQLAREDGENVGLYKIYYVEGSNTNSNYQVVFKADSYSFEITPKKLIVMANAMQKTFGQDDSELTFKMYLDGSLCDKLLFDDQLLGHLSRQEGEDVGLYDITLGSLANDNYSIVFVSNKYTIVPKDVNVKIDNISITYGENQELTFSLDEGNSLEYIYGSLTRESGEDVGEYVISSGTLSSHNYNLIVSNGVYKILPKEVIVYAQKSNKYYGDKDSITFTTSGLINGDQLLGQLSREEGEDVGEYAILQGDLHHKNYTIIFESNILTIKQAKLSIKFDDKNQVYGEAPIELTYQVFGMKNNEILNIKAIRESGEDVGEYQIAGVFAIPTNYTLDSIQTGIYTIKRAKLNLTLNNKTITYNGKPQTIDTNFAYPVKFVYTSATGRIVDECIDAGVYTVQAIFEGNQNYEPAISKEVTLEIVKQYVFITTLNTSFIYDGTIKYPEFSYDKNIAIDNNAFVFKFENDVFPQEEGQYNFAIIIDDINYEGQTQGTIKIQKPLSITNENSSIVECSNATFDESAKNLKLVQDNNTKTFNNEKVISVCTLENVSEKASGYIYTVKVKATQGVENVKVYKVGQNGFSQQAIKIEDGYYVFKIDDPNDKYIITTEVKTLSTLAWILILVSVVMVFSVTLIIVARRKHKKAKVNANKISDKDIETYNVN